MAVESPRVSSRFFLPSLAQTPATRKPQIPHDPFLMRFSRTSCQDGAPAVPALRAERVRSIAVNVALNDVVQAGIERDLPRDRE